MENNTNDHTTILQSLTNPVVYVKLQTMAEADIAALVASASKEYGMPESYIRASLRMTLHHILQAISLKRGPRQPKPQTALEPTPLETSIEKAKSKGTKNSAV